MRTERKLRADAARIWLAALAAVDPEAAVRRHVRRTGSVLRIGSKAHNLSPGRRVWVIALGKAAAAMARPLERILGRHLAGGIVVTKYGHGLPTRKLDALETGHPLPDRNGVEAARRVRRLARNAIAPDDLVLALLSGGGSALLVDPAPDISFAVKFATTDLLLRSGATIREMNAIRKHLSGLKGGGLARLLDRTAVVSLVLSDVVGDDLSTIASGPLVPDPTTFQDCLGILRRLGIEDRIPAAVRRRFEAGARGKVPETPKPDDPIFRNKTSLVIGSNAVACSAALGEARRLGYRALVLTSRLEGDTAESARFHTSIAEEIAFHGRPLRRPACILSGGETTVRVRGGGLGGRNQEFVLHCAGRLARLPVPCVIASLGTDGTDGPTDAAGAIADGRTAARALEAGPRLLDDAARNNDSYNFFRRLDDLIVTGPTRTNVSDLRILLVG